MLRLISQDAATLESMISAEEFRDRHGASIDGHLELARDMVRQTLDLGERVGAEPPWIGYLAVDDASRAVIGCCGFTGNPSQDGSVEIAYFTFPPNEGKGHATEMARMLVGIAREQGGVRHVIAHTLPEVNASTRVLQKLGFARVGEITDPEDGLIWRWRLE